MTEDQEIYQLRTAIELKRKEVRADFAKNERLGTKEIVVVLLMILAAASVFILKPRLSVIEATCYDTLAPAVTAIINTTTSSTTTTTMTTQQTTPTTTGTTATTVATTTGNCDSDGNHPVC